eukprot:g31705.t1
MDCPDWTGLLQKYVIGKWLRNGECAGHIKDKGKPAGEALRKVAQAQVSDKKFKTVQKVVAISPLLEELIKCRQQSELEGDRLEEENRRLHEKVVCLSEK